MDRTSEGGYAVTDPVLGRTRHFTSPVGAEDDGDGGAYGHGYTDGDLTEVVNSSGVPLRLAYDERDRITSWTDTNDRRFTYAYDDQDRCIAEGGTDGRLALTLGYDTSTPRRACASPRRPRVRGTSAAI
ncbi:hypothetical protein [Streptomyces sp. NPDC003952]